jgi:hypothetical protein
MSPASDTALEEAIDMGLLEGLGHLYITHVIESPYRFNAEMVNPPMLLSMSPEIFHATEEMLKERYHPMTRALTETSFHVLHGVEAVEVLRFIRKNRPDMVLLSLELARRKRPHLPGNLEEMLRRSSPSPVWFFDPCRKRGKERPSRHTPDDPEPKAKVLDLGAYRLARR